MKKMILLVFAFSIMGGCSKSPLDVLGSKNYSISGHVVDIATNTPLAGIKVGLTTFDGFLDIRGTEVVTNEKGGFQINFEDTQDFYLYWAELTIGLPSEVTYQLGVNVNGEEHCKSSFAVGNTGNYEIQLLRYPSYRLQVPSVPSGWETGRLDAELSTLNPNCSDTLLIESVSARLNNTAEMNELSKWRKIGRSNKVFVNYTLNIDNVVYVSKKISTECAYGGQTDVYLTLE